MASRARIASLLHSWKGRESLSNWPVTSYTSHVKVCVTESYARVPKAPGSRIAIRSNGLDSLSPIGCFSCTYLCKAVQDVKSLVSNLRLSGAVSPRTTALVLVELESRPLAVRRALRSFKLEHATWRGLCVPSHGPSP